MTKRAGKYVMGGTIMRRYIDGSFDIAEPWGADGRRETEADQRLLDYLEEIDPNPIRF